MLVGESFATRLTGRYGTVTAHAKEGVVVWWLDKRAGQTLHPDVKVDVVGLLGVPCPEETVA
jgi:hypothetical protein